MGDPVKYLTVVTEVLKLYQNQLLEQFKKLNGKELKAFAKNLNEQLAKLKAIQEDKGIHEDQVSEVCKPMEEYLVVATRPSRTSQSERYAIRASLMSQQGNRMRFTGGIKKSPPKHEYPTPIQESSAQMNDIIQSYRIQDQLVPRMRMKWKSFKHDQLKNNGKKSTIGDNNIDLLSYTIPQIENSIKRLSLQSRDHRQKSPEHGGFDAYRTVDTRSHNKRKYVPRLI